jgi:hypothetical protein
MSDDNEKITFNELCKSCNVIVPEIFLDAIELKYTPVECVQLLSKIILTNDSLNIIDPNLIDKYILSKNKNGLIKFR